MIINLVNLGDKTLSKYVLRVLIGQANTAGQKAKEDIESILKNYGFIPINISIKKNRVMKLLFSRIEINSKLKEMKNGDSFVIQYPMYSKLATFMILSKCKKKNIKTIGFMHDLESLRLYKNSKNKIKNELLLLKKFDILIVHNEKMKDWLSKNGLTMPMIPLEVFDYINNKKIVDAKANLPLVLAGNLEKAKFLEKWNLKKQILVFGVKPSTHYPENVIYGGVKSPDELPKFLSGSFGLVWDGDSLDTNTGKYGHYTRYNNPHKVSLYLSCGIPIIVWSQAAISKFIIDNNLGISVSSLQELESILENITDKEYSKMLQNVRKFSKKIRKGHYTIKSIDAALQKID